MWVDINVKQGMGFFFFTGGSFIKSDGLVFWLEVKNVLMLDLIQLLSSPDVH